MSIDAHLIHRCNVERPTVAVDPFGNRQESWPAEPWIRDLHCRLVVQEQRYVSGDKAELAFTTTYKLLVPPGADVTKGDRVSGLTLEDGTLWGATYIVTAILPRRGKVERHRTIRLEVAT